MKPYKKLRYSVFYFLIYKIFLLTIPKFDVQGLHHPPDCKLRGRVGYPEKNKLISFSYFTF